MIVVRHRVNEAKILEKCPINQGVEIDIRSDNEGLYLSHDPFVSGERLGKFLSSYRHKLLILNVKEDGLEDAISRELSRSKVRNYFFLDQAGPTIIRRGGLGNKEAAIRYSEYESLETVKLMAHFASWVWIDSFSKRELDPDLIETFRAIGLKTCLVSPELHDLARESEADDFVERSSKLGLKFDAVCTKFPEKWESLT